METSILIARILSISYLAFGFGLILSPKFYKREIPKLADNPALMLYGGLAAIAIVYVFIHYHNIWDGTWVVGITIFDWIGLCKGIILLIFPTVFSRLKNSIFSEARLVKILLPITLVAGAFFGYFGFISF